MIIKQLREKANNLPMTPGVYIMKDSNGVIIYVGKAKKLKNRVSSYFRGSHLPKVEAMVEKVDDFEYITVNSEFEALILENSLIKKHQPHYNILLKDDKGFPFIKIDPNADYPRMEIVSKNDDDKSVYYGPYGGRDITRSIIQAIEQALKLPDCSRKFPDCIGKDRPCLNYTIGLCDGWCMNNNREEYISRFNQARMILDGNSSELISQLEEKMYKAADEQKFEYAAILRDRIKNVEGLNNKQRVTKKGSSRYFIPQNSKDNNYYQKNTVTTLNTLAEMLSINKYPRRIESFDVSNLGNSGIVSAMTVFIDGKAKKSEYRKFRIKDIIIHDDYASMYQTIIRRFTRMVDNDSKFSDVPDLLLVDGGQLHAQTVEKALQEFDLDIPVFGMVKDSHHKTKALVSSNGDEVSIKSNLSVYSLIGTIQEETHRFAIDYQRHVRYENYGSELDSIPGVGKERKAKLLVRFKSVKAIKDASFEQLCESVPSNVAKSIYNYFHGE